MHKQDLNPKFIDCSGYSLSGKSAVLELFQEFEGYFASGREVDFELLWRCISKTWNQFRMAIYMKKIEINNNKYNYSELTVVFSMFILVS